MINRSSNKPSAAHYATTKPTTTATTTKNFKADESSAEAHPWSCMHN